MARTESSESAGTGQRPRRRGQCPTPNGRQTPARRQVREKNPKSTKIDKMSKFRGGKGQTEGKSATHLSRSASSRPRIHHTVTQGHTKTSCLMAEQSWTPWMVWKYPKGCRRMKVMGWRCPDGHSRMKVWAHSYLWSISPGWALSVQLPPPAVEIIAEGLCRQLILINIYPKNMKRQEVEMPT